MDGGTSRWISWLQSNRINSATINSPDLITGDMDSVLMEEAKDYFPESKFIITPNQDETDFTKALIELGKYKQAKNITVCFVCYFM